ncbi:hypothetical protein O7627_07270 [Solwaraspora sp. WMMD1047]|uniref:hypothetical protein n=1 Tax=Solwaraspora sp. WMMD1047 TaxID=3016102 RepID=UPI002416C5EB|nr:hypothetical protein [Solwaraspora sp. WMMD1047]MDG4829104.1 hypothetical protein [Solwaraspora sp. WMMD1047]
MEPHGLTGIADAGAFLARLTRLDPGALVRLRSDPVAGGRAGLWARLPWSVLVTRGVAGAGPDDATVSAAELLAELDRGGPALPARRDAQWRWPLPPATGRVVETMPGADLRDVAAAAAGTLRSAESGGVGGRAVGQRALRDALLDHVAVVVTASDSRVEVTQRLVQAVVRMGFLGRSAGAESDGVQVRVAGRWTGLSGPFGTAWSRSVDSLMLSPVQDQPNG